MKPIGGTVILGIVLTFAAIQFVTPAGEHALGAPEITLITVICLGLAALIVALVRSLFKRRPK